MGVLYFNCTPAPGQMGVLAIAGDSITNGYGVAPGSSWGEQLSALVAARAYFNGGHNGEYSNDMLVHHPSEIAAHLSRVGHPVAVLEIGTNDIATGVVLATIVANVEAWIAASQAVGYTAGLCTVLDRTAILSVSQGTFNSQRALFNAHVRTTTAADFIIDFDTDPRLLDSTSTTYFQDGVHPKASGAAVMASIGATQITAAIAA